MTTQDLIREQQRKRTAAFNAYTNGRGGAAQTPDFNRRFQQFSLDDSEDTRSVAESDYADQRAKWSNPNNTPTPNEPFTPQAPPVYGMPSTQKPFYDLRNPYVEASRPSSNTVALRNNFNGAESAPHGSIIKGVDNLLYRKSPAGYARIQPPSLDDFEPGVAGSESQGPEGELSFSPEIRAAREKSNADLVANRTASAKAMQDYLNRTAPSKLPNFRLGNGRDGDTLAEALQNQPTGYTGGPASSGMGVPARLARSQALLQNRGLR